MFYSNKNCKILINNGPIYANEASINVQNDTSQNVLVGSNDSSYSVGNIESNGTLTFSHFLTGEDFIKRNLVLTQNNFIKGEFGGLNFESGYISSYSLNMVPNLPVEANVSISFWGDLKGQFSPTKEVLPKRKILNFSDCSISSDFLNVNEITNINYRANVENSFSFFDGETGKAIFGPNRIISSRKESSCDVACSDLTGYISYSGNGGYISVSFGDSFRDEVEDVFVSGLIVSKSLDFSKNPIQAIYSLRQDNITNYGPFISGFQPSPVEINREVTISGLNFEGFNSLLYDKYVVQNAKYRKDKGVPYIKFSISSYIVSSGKLTVITSRGKDVSTDYLYVHGGQIGSF